MHCKLFKHHSSHYLWSILCLTTTFLCGLFLYAVFTNEKNACGFLKRCPEPEVIVADRRISENCNSVCMSKGCILGATFLRSNLNESVNPCEDFYSFACGNYGKNLGKDESSSIIYELNDALKAAVKDVLDNMKSSPGTPTWKLQMVYQSCLNESTFELKAVSTAKEFLNQAGIKNWPNLPHDFEFKQPDLAHSLSIFVMYSQFSFITFKRRKTPLTSGDGLDIMTIRQRCSLLTDYSTEIVRSRIETILYYMDVKEHMIGTIWEEFVSIDTALKKSFTDHIYEDDICDRYIVTDDCYLNGVVDVIINCLEESDDNMKFICSVLKSVVENLNATSIYSKNHFHVPCNMTDYMKDIFVHLRSFPHRSIANYLALRFLLTKLDVMSLPFRQIVEGFVRSNLYNQYEFCSGWIAENMHRSFGSLYVPSKIPNTEDVYEIIDDCIDAGFDIVDHQEWMAGRDRTVLQNTMKSLKTMIRDIKYPIVPTFKNDSAISYFYDQFHPTSESFLWNVLKVKKLAYTHQILPCSELRDAYSSNPFEVEAYGGCEILGVGFGILLPPMYQYGNLKVISFAKLGYLIGHEIGHVAQCMLEEGTPDNITVRNSVRKQECLWKQYSEFEMEEIGKKIQANTTNGEDVSDSIGLIIAETALKRYLERTPASESMTLPGLNFSPQQLFYISMAQIYCTKMTYDAAENYWLGNVHSAPKFRAIGMFQNSKKFAETFNCPKGSYMNPEGKCPYFE